MNFWVFCEMKRDEQGQDYPATELRGKEDNSLIFRTMKLLLMDLANLLYAEQVDACHIHNVIEDCLAAGALPV